MLKQVANWVRILIGAMLMATVLIALVEAIGLNLVSLAE
jgi:hypothetical protein